MYVIKESGEKQKLDLKKIKKTIVNAKASPELTDEAIRELKKKIYPGIKTKEILQIIIKLLKKEPGVAERYSLRRAVMVLGPTGFIFEKFIARVLKEYGYKARTNAIIHGKCVNQEVDVIAKKKKKTYMIECKYHNSPGKKSDLKVMMYTYARFLDIKHKHFNQPWLVTNTKCTSEAKKYAKGVKLKIISWDYPKKESLEKLLVEKKLYPITTLMSISFAMKRRLVKSKIILLRDILKHTTPYLMRKTKISKKILEKIRKEAKEIIKV